MKLLPAALAGTLLCAAVCFCVMSSWQAQEEWHGQASNHDLNSGSSPGTTIELPPTDGTGRSSATRLCRVIISARTAEFAEGPIEAAVVLDWSIPPGQQRVPTAESAARTEDDLGSHRELCQLTANPHVIAEVQRPEGTELELTIIPLRSGYEVVHERSIVEYPSTTIDIRLARTVPEPASFRIRVVDATSWTPLTGWTALLCDDDYGGLEAVGADWCTYLPKYRSAILGMARSQSGEDVTMAYGNRPAFLAVVPDGRHALAIAPVPDPGQGNVMVAVQGGHEVVLRADPDVVQPISMTITIGTELNEAHDPSGVGTVFFPVELFASSVTPAEGRFPCVPFETAFGFMAPADCRNPVDCTDRICHMDHVTCVQSLEILQAARVQFRGFLGSSDVSMEGVVWCLPASGPEVGALFDPDDPTALRFDWARLNSDAYDCLKCGDYWIGPGYCIDESGPTEPDAIRSAHMARIGSRVSVLPGDQVAVVQVPVVDGHYFHGSIVDAAGAPISDRRVLIRMPGYAGHASATTGAEGDFVCGPLPAGNLACYLETTSNAGTELSFLGSAVSPSESQVFVLQ